MRLFLSSVAIAAVLAVIPQSAWAHHSGAAEYGSKLIILTGTVTKVEWMNPHVHFSMDVAGEKGVVTHWDLEMASPNGMLRQGWVPKSMKPGDVVTVEAYGAKDNASLAKVHSVKLANGHTLFADSTGLIDAQK